MTPVALAFAALIGSNTPVQALSFNFTFSDATPLAVRSVFWDAGDAWSKRFTDDVTVNIFVDYGTLPTNVLAGARPGMARVTYSEFLTGLRQDKGSQDGSKYVSQEYDDARALSNLQAGTNFKYLRNAYNANQTWGGGTQVDNEDKVWLTRANAKALGLINQQNSDYNSFDASIRISNAAQWHYDTNIVAPSSKHDLLNVATHEIGHALGFVSGVDAFQLLSVGGNLTVQNLDHFTPMDLLRYSQQSAAQKIPDWTTSQTFLSLDGGSNSIGGLSMGATIDGFQSGHWKHGESRGVMTPFLKTGERVAISELDRQLLDAIGWDRGAQLSKNMASAMLGINWNTSNPDLRLVENLLKAHLTVEMEKLRQQRDAIQNWDSKISSELRVAADNEFQKRQQGIAETLNKIRVEKYNPAKRMEEALKGTSVHLEALAALAKVYETKLQPPLSAQINNWLNGSQQELKNNLKNATELQLRTLAAKVRNAEASQRNKWENDIKEALRLLYQEMYGNQYPSAIELNTALAKLLDDATPDSQEGRSTRYWQTGDIKSSFEKTGEFSFYSDAPESDVVPMPAGTKGMLGLGLFGIGFLLLRRGKKSSKLNISHDLRNAP